MKQKKKKIAALSLAALVAGTGAFHAYGNYQQSGESDALLNENILALSSESESEESEGTPCWYDIIPAYGHMTLWCVNCEWVDGEPALFSKKGYC